MMFETIDQAGVFLAMVYAGLAIGLLYDALRLLRRTLAAKALLTAFLDLIFWLSAGVVAAVALALRNEDSMRLYALGGCASGVVLYMLGISRVLQAAGKGIARMYRRVEETPKWQAKLARQQANQLARQQAMVRQQAEKKENADRAKREAQAKKEQRAKDIARKKEQRTAEKAARTKKRKTDAPVNPR